MKCVTSKAHEMEILFNYKHTQDTYIASKMHYCKGIAMIINYNYRLLALFNMKIDYFTSDLMFIIIKYFSKKNQIA